MADTISTYQRQKSDAQYLSTVRTPSASSMEAQGKYTRQYMAGLTGLVEGVGKVVDAYWTAIEHREERDADSSATELFRQRRADLRQGVKGKDADGLLDRETEWTKDQFNKWVKDKGISTQAGKLIWEKHARQHLDKVGAYMIEQQAAYDKASRMRWVDNQIDNLAESKTGDMNQLKEVWRQAELTFPDDPMQAEKYIDKATSMAFGTWSARDPEGTLKWFDANSGAIAKVIGSKFPQAQKTMETIRRRLIREAEHRAAQAAAQAARAAAEYNRQSHMMLNNIALEMARGNPAAARQAYTAPGLTASDRQRVHKMLMGEGKRANKGTPSPQEKAEEESNFRQVYTEAFHAGMVGDNEAIGHIAEQWLAEGKDPRRVKQFFSAFKQGNGVDPVNKQLVYQARKTLRMYYGKTAQGSAAEFELIGAAAKNPDVFKDAKTAAAFTEAIMRNNPQTPLTPQERILGKPFNIDEFRANAPGKQTKSPTPASAPAPASKPATPPAGSSGNSILKGLEEIGKGVTPNQKRLLDTSEAQVRTEDTEPRPGLID